MTDTEKQAETIPQLPLNRNEVSALTGAGMVVLGTLLPALNPGYGSAQTLAESGNTVAVVLWGMAAAVAWKVVLRQAHDAPRVGVLCFLFLAAYGVFVWIDVVREPVKTFLGTLQANLKPTAWVVIAVGSVLIVFSARREPGDCPAKSDAANAHRQISAIGVTLAVLGCLVGFAIVNPFSSMAPAEFRSSWRAWSDEIHALRWIGLSTAAMAIVAGSQYPRRTLVILKPVIQTFGLLIGVCLIFIAGLIEPSARALSVTVAALWSVVSLAIFATGRSRPMVRWQQLVVWSPFVTVFVLLVVSGEIRDGMLILTPAFMVGAGYVICRNTTYVDAAIFSSALVVALPAGSMALSGVPNEIADVCGMSHAESRVILLGVCALLSWAVYLSFLNEGVTSSAVIPCAHDVGDKPEKSTET